MIRTWPLLLPAALVACSGSGSDTGWWDVDPADPGHEGVPFEPDVVMVYAYASYDGDILDEFMLEPGNPASTLPPVVIFLFADNRFFSTWNEDYTCEWVGQITVEGVDDMGRSDLWLSYAISLKMLENTCYDMDPWVWGETTPSSVLESKFLGLGYGPISTAFESELRALVDAAGDDYATNWAPYVYATHLGIQDDFSGTLVPHEVAFTFSYEMADGALTSALDDQPIPIPLTEGTPPQGLMIGSGWSLLDPAAFF